MEICTGRPIFIHPPPIPHQSDIYSSTHIHLDGKNILLYVNETFQPYHQLASTDALHVTYLMVFLLVYHSIVMHSIINQILAFPYQWQYQALALEYFMMGARLYSEAFVVNSNRVINMIIPIIL